MGYLEIADEANRYSNKLGTFMFLFSGGGVAFNYYIPGLIPIILIGGMYTALSMSILGMVLIYLQHLRNPHHAIGEKCPKCQKSLLNTGIKCSNPKCDYKVRF